jgi:hypothetical protein
VEARDRLPWSFEDLGGLESEETGLKSLDLIEVNRGCCIDEVVVIEVGSDCCSDDIVSVGLCS